MARGLMPQSKMSLSFPLALESSRVASRGRMRTRAMRDATQSPLCTPTFPCTSHGRARRRRARHGLPAHDGLFERRHAVHGPQVGQERRIELRGCYCVSVSQPRQMIARTIGGAERGGRHSLRPMTCSYGAGVDAGVRQPGAGVAALRHRWSDVSARKVVSVRWRSVSG